MDLRYDCGQYVAETRDFYRIPCFGSIESWARNYGLVRMQHCNLNPKFSAFGANNDFKTNNLFLPF